MSRADPDPMFGVAFLASTGADLHSFICSVQVCLEQLIFIFLGQRAFREKLERNQRAIKEQAYRAIRDQSESKQRKNKEQSESKQEY